ncbi:MAG: class I SAM-dependent methyltransferase [Alphaproteobacteria bacterium]|nr:MAG: class I SAM-dependent methyltransferase [Alphaproteobacteria bacterium]
MHLDVVRLRDFYHTPLGLVCARLIGRKLRSLWPDVKGMNVLGLGYATPYLGPFAYDRSAARVLCLMAASQGVHVWSPVCGARRGNLAGITEENALPLPDESIDRILLVHILETSDRPRSLLREVWRVLAPGGRIIAVAPNRTGCWAFFERTPFGHGRPYTRAQFEASLREHMFAPVAHATSLFAPPLKGRVGVRAVMAFEDLGARWWPRIGGVHIVEAEKRVYASDSRPPVRVVKPLPMPTSGW